jgi:hypothetical protein
MATNKYKEPMSDKRAIGIAVDVLQTFSTVAGKEFAAKMQEALPVLKRLYRKTPSPKKEKEKVLTPY